MEFQLIALNVLKIELIFQIVKYVLKKNSMIIKIQAVKTAQVNVIIVQVIKITAQVVQEIEF